MIDNENSINKKQKWFLLRLIFFLGLFNLPVYYVYAQNNYPTCQNFSELPESENFCTRIEGVYPKGCCPPLKGKTLRCHYAEKIRNGQPVKIKSSFTACQNGKNVKIDCCRQSAQDCYGPPEVRRFISFLNFRKDQRPEGTCCMAICPSSRYWATHPDPSKRLNGDYDWFGEGLPPNQCQNSIINKCGGVTQSCQASSPCPTNPPSPPSPPNPNPPNPPNPNPPNPNPPSPPNPPNPSPPSPPPSPPPKPPGAG